MVKHLSVVVPRFEPTAHIYLSPNPFSYNMLSHIGIEHLPKKKARQGH